ncbi:hypothetical protein LY13_003860 [Prauserella aidingensis]|nr:hypothetical protein [Prauserella aidingensis]
MIGERALGIPGAGARFPWAVRTEGSPCGERLSVAAWEMPI